MAGLEGALAVRGAAAGLKDVQQEQEHQRDRQYLQQARAQHLQEGDLAIQQTQQQMDRQNTLAQEQDQAYQQKLHFTQYMQNWQNAMRRFITSDGADYSGVTDVYNDYPSQTGHQVSISRNKDGTFNVVTQQNGKITGQKTLTMDQVGQTMMALRDPSTYMTNLSARQAKAADQQFQLQKMEKQYGLEGWLALVKAGAAGSGNGVPGGGSPVSFKNMTKLDKDMWSRATTQYGSMNNGILSLDAGSKTKAAQAAFLAVKMFKAMPKPDENEAFLRSIQVVDSLGQVAQQRAAQQTDDPDRQQVLQGQIMNQLLTQTAAQLEGSRGQPRGRAAGRPQIPQGAIAKLRANPKLAPYFDEKYGKGQAAAVLQASPSGSPSTPGQQSAPGAAAAPASSPKEPAQQPSTPGAQPQGASANAGLQTDVNAVPPRAPAGKTFGLMPSDASAVASLASDQGKPSKPDKAYQRSLQQNFARNKQWAKKGSYTTKLAPSQEKRFRQWVLDNNVPFNPNAKVTDYDMRGFWLALQQGDPVAKTAVNSYDHKIHFPDKWKTPYDKTFSQESIYATKNAPHWLDNRWLMDDKGHIIFDSEVDHGG